MNQSELQAIILYLLNARENCRIQGAMGFGLAFHWLKNWREIFKPISKRSNLKLLWESSALSIFFLHYVLSTELRQLWLLLLLLLCNEKMIITSASQWWLKVCHPLTLKPALEQTIILIYLSSILVEWSVFNGHVSHAIQEGRSYEPASWNGLQKVYTAAWRNFGS